MAFKIPSSDSPNPLARLGLSMEVWYSKYDQERDHGMLVRHPTPGELAAAYGKHGVDIGKGEIVNSKIPETNGLALAIERAHMEIALMCLDAVQGIKEPRYIQNDLKMHMFDSDCFKEILPSPGMLRPILVELGNHLVEKSKVSENEGKPLEHSPSSPAQTSAIDTEIPAQVISPVAQTRNSEGSGVATAPRNGMHSEGHHLSTTSEGYG